jgi:hypothetical protein
MLLLTHSTNGTVWIAPVPYVQSGTRMYYRTIARIRVVSHVSVFSDEAMNESDAIYSMSIHFKIR